MLGIHHILVPLYLLINISTHPAEHEDMVFISANYNLNLDDKQALTSAGCHLMRCGCGVGVVCISRQTSKSPVAVLLNAKSEG